MHNVFKTRWNLVTCFENLKKCVKLIGNIFKLPSTEDNIRIENTTYSGSKRKIWPMLINGTVTDGITDMHTFILLVIL